MIVLALEFNTRLVNGGYNKPTYANGYKQTVLKAGEP